MNAALFVDATIVFSENLFLVLQVLYVLLNYQFNKIRPIFIILAISTASVCVRVCVCVCVCVFVCVHVCVCMCTIRKKMI